MDQLNPKLWHSKGLAFQTEAEKKMSGKKEVDAGDIKDLNSKAIDMFQEAIRIQDSFVASRFHLGLMYHRTAQFQPALKCFTKVLQKIQDDKTVYLARGCVFYDMGNYKMAIDDFKQAIDLD